MGRKFKNKGAKLPKGVKLPIIRKLAKEDIATQLKNNATGLQNTFNLEGIRLPQESILSYNTRKTFEALSAEKNLYEATRQEYSNIIENKQIMGSLTPEEKSILDNLKFALDSYEKAAKGCGVDQLLSEYNAKLQASAPAENIAMTVSPKAPQPAAPSFTLEKNTAASATTAYDANFNQLSKVITELEQAVREFPALYKQCKNYDSHKTLIDTERTNLIRLKEILNLYTDAMVIKQRIITPNAMEELYNDLLLEAKPKPYDSKFNNEEKKLLARVNTATATLRGKTEINKTIDLVNEADTLLNRFDTQLRSNPQAKNAKLDSDVPPPLDPPPPPPDTIIAPDELQEETDSNTESTSSDEEISAPDINQKFSTSNAENNDQEPLLGTNENKPQPALNERNDHAFKSNIDQEDGADTLLNRFDTQLKSNPQAENAKIDSDVPPPLEPPPPPPTGNDDLILHMTEEEDKNASLYQQYADSIARKAMDTHEENQREEFFKMVEQSEHGKNKKEKLATAENESNSSLIEKLETQLLSGKIKNKEVIHQYKEGIAAVSKEIRAVSKYVMSQLTDFENSAVTAKAPKSHTQIANAFNSLSSYVKFNILNAESLERATLRMEFWITVMKDCLEKGDFHSTISILSALQTTVITRLKLEDHLSSHAKQLLNQLKALIGEKPDEQYNLIISHSNPDHNVTPYLGAFKSILDKADDAHKASIANALKKYQKDAEKLPIMAREKASSLQQAIMTPPLDQKTEDNQLYALSDELRKKEHNKSAKLTITDNTPLKLDVRLKQYASKKDNFKIARNNLNKKSINDTAAKKVINLLESDKYKNKKLKIEFIDKLLNGEHSELGLDGKEKISKKTRHLIKAYKNALLELEQEIKSFQLEQGLEQNASTATEISIAPVKPTLAQEKNDEFSQIDSTNFYDPTTDTHNTPTSHSEEEANSYTFYDPAQDDNNLENNTNSPIYGATVDRMENKYKSALEKVYLTAQEIGKSTEISNTSNLEVAINNFKNILEELSSHYNKAINMDEAPIIIVAERIQELAKMGMPPSEVAKQQLEQARIDTLQFIKNYENDALESIIDKLEASQPTENKNLNLFETPPNSEPSNTTTEDFSALERKTNTTLGNDSNDLIPFLQNNPHNDQILQNPRLANKFATLLSRLFNGEKIIKSDANFKASDTIFKRIEKLSSNEVVKNKLYEMASIDLNKDPSKSSFEALISPKKREKEIDDLATEFAPEVKDIPIKKPRVKFVKGNRPSGNEQSKNLLSQQRVVDSVPEEEIPPLILKAIIDESDKRKKPSSAKIDSEINDLRAFVEGLQHEAYPALDESIHKQIEALADTKLHELASIFHEAINIDTNTLTIDEAFQNEIRKGLDSYSETFFTNNEQQISNQEPEAKPVTDDKPSMNDLNKTLSMQASLEDETIYDKELAESKPSTNPIDATPPAGTTISDTEASIISPITSPIELSAPTAEANATQQDQPAKTAEPSFWNKIFSSIKEFFSFTKESPKPNSSEVKPDKINVAAAPINHAASSTAKTAASLDKTSVANQNNLAHQNVTDKFILSPFIDNKTYKEGLGSLNDRAKQLYGTRVRDNITGHLSALSDEDRKALPPDSVEEILKSIEASYKKITNTIHTRYDELYQKTERLIRLAVSGVSGNIGQQKAQLDMLLNDLKAATQLNMPLLEKELKDTLSLDPRIIFSDKIDALQKILKNTNTNPSMLVAKLETLKLTGGDVKSATEAQCQAFTDVIKNAYREAKAAAPAPIPVNPTTSSATFAPVPASAAASPATFVSPSSPADTEAPAAFVSREDTIDVYSLLRALPTAPPISATRYSNTSPALAQVAGLIEKHEKAKYPQSHFSYEKKRCSLNEKYINVIHVKRYANALSKEDLQVINSESLKVRKLSLIAGMINILGHSNFFLAGPNRQQFIAKLEELANQVDQQPNNPRSLETEMNEFIKKLISTAKGFCNLSPEEILREIRNAERYYVAEKNQQAALVFEHKDKDNKTIYQIDIPLGNKLTDEQKQSFIAIHDEANMPTWFKNLPQFEKGWFRNMVPKSLQDDWSIFENLYQSSAMQHIPGIKNGRTNYLVQHDTTYGMQILSSSLKTATLVPYEIPEAEQDKQTKQNAQQAFVVLKQKALENKQEKWGNHLNDLPPLILFQALLSNTILSQDDSKLYASQVEAINTIQATDKSFVLIAGTEAVNILGKVSPQTRARWEYADQVIAYADKLLKKLEGIKLTPAQEQFVKLITDAKNNLKNLKNSQNFSSTLAKIFSPENLETFKVAYLAILVEAMGGVVSTNCKSGKDRTGLEEIYCHAMRLYFEQEGRLPQLSDKSIQREKFIAIYKELFDSMKIQEAAAMNTPGSFGINDKAMMLSSEIAKALGKSYESSTERAVMNKPTAFKKDEEKQAKQMRTVKEDVAHAPNHPAIPAATPKAEPPKSSAAAPLAPPSEEPPKPPVASPVAPAATSVSKAAPVPPSSMPPAPSSGAAGKSSEPGKLSSDDIPSPEEFRRAFQSLFQTTAEAKAAAIALREEMRLWQEVREKRAKPSNPDSGLAL